LLPTPSWSDYELIDSGGGQKLERYGPYTFVRPEHQAIWNPALPQGRWQQAHAIFQPAREESGGRWQFNQPVKTPWQMQYKKLRFLSFTANSRHMGVFPEQAAHWDWIAALIEQRVASSQNPVKVLNLFGYTGLATLAAASAGAQATHVDASRKVLQVARENQTLCGLSSHPIRWLEDDAFKFVRREVRRGSQYDGIILDPPKFGRGPQGQVWELFESLPDLLQNCRSLLSAQPLFIVLTAYAIRASALSIYYAMQEMVAGLPGKVEAGELALVESSAGRLLSTAIYARWHTEQRE
jgi:23S rRNA (cytosine1962-C5)-methyltransferase